MSTFARKLRERAEELQLPFAEVARRCGLTERRFGHYVSGAREPDLATLVKICSTLDTTPNTLLGVDQPPKRTGEHVNLHAAIGAGISSLSIANLRVVRAMVDFMVVEQRKLKGKPA
jgi:transcriptional regulator with XRE-family HTH domain